MKITNNQKLDIEKSVLSFNERHGCLYQARFRGKYIYLDRADFSGAFSPICKLTFNGSIEDLEFSIYKYSTGKYCPDEIFFPGIQCLDGTVEGAMLAGLEAYE